MDERSLMAFIKKILLNGSPEKAGFSLNQLAEILRMQHADPGQIKLVKEAAESAREAKDAAAKPDFLKQDLVLAIRASKKRRREEELYSRGRC